MKRILLIFSFLFLFSTYSIAQISEDFDTGLANSYTTGSQVLDSGTWQTVNVFQEFTSNSRSGNAARFNDDKAESSLTTPILSSVGEISFWYRELNSGGGDILIQTSTDGTNFTTVDTQAYSGQTFSQYTYTLNNSNNIYIKIRISNEAGHLIVDDFSTTAYSNDLTVSSDQTISSDLSYDNVTVNSGQTLTISKSGSLTVSGNFTNNGTVILNSASDEYSSLIVQGTSSGNVTYNRWINNVSNSSPTDGDEGWDLVGSPVVGASLTTSNFAQNGTSDAILPYNNSDNTWTSTDQATFSTTSGLGYAMAKQSAGTEPFTGTIETSDKNVSITNNDGSGSGTQWNLVANPYPSYLALNSNARSASSATTDFITQNAVTADVLGSGTNEDALWYWTGSGYGQYNN